MRAIVLLVNFSPFMKKYKLLIILIAVLTVFGAALVTSGNLQGLIFKLKPAYNENKCYDSDNGKNYEIKGTTFGKMAPRSTQTQYSDFCENNTLSEYYCNGQNVNKEIKDCIDCDKGACVPKNSTIGGQKIAVVPFNYQDCKLEPQSKENIESKYFNPTNEISANHILFELSFGKTWFEPEIFDYHTIPLSANMCSQYIGLGNTNLNHDFLRYFDDYINYSLYDSVLMMLPTSCGCSGGYGTKFTDVQTNDGKLDIEVIMLPLDVAPETSAQNLTDSRGLIHEWGHTKGLKHVPLFDCGINMTGNLGEGCSLIDRGNQFDLMAKITFGHFNVFYKNFLGWLDVGNIVKVVSSGQYTLEPLEKKTDGIQMIKIPAIYKIWDSDGVFYSKNYFLELRKNIGLDDTGFRDNCVVIYLDSDMPDKYVFTLNSDLSETHPRYKQCLEIGETFYDNDMGLSIKFAEINETGALVNIELP